MKMFKLICIPILFIIIFGFLGPFLISSGNTELVLLGSVIIYATLCGIGYEVYQRFIKGEINEK